MGWGSNLFALLREPQRCRPRRVRQKVRCGRADRGGHKGPTTSDAAGGTACPPDDWRPQQVPPTPSAPCLSYHHVRGRMAAGRPAGWPSRLVLRVTLSPLRTLRRPTVDGEELLAVLTTNRGAPLASSPPSLATDDFGRAGAGPCGPAMARRLLRRAKQRAAGSTFAARLLAAAAALVSPTIRGCSSRTSRRQRASVPRRRPLVPNEAGPQAPHLLTPRCWLSVYTKLSVPL